MNKLIIGSAYSDQNKAAEIATITKGVLLLATAAETAHLPFAALVLSVSDDVKTLVDHADVGTYLICERDIKNSPIFELSQEDKPGCVGIFTMVANPELGNGESDKHWRDNHAPLALEIHTAMTHYYQLSIQHRFSGPDWNGFALCCFQSEDDLRHRFFNGPEGEKAIAKDVARFADTRLSPRRVIASFNR